MSNKISGLGPLSTFKQYTTQKRWVAIALLVTSVVVFGGLTALGGLSLFSSHSIFSQVFNAIGRKGALAALIGGGVAATFGTVVSIALLINKGRSPIHRAIENKTDIDQLLQEADVNQADHDGNRPIHYAASNGHGLDELLNATDIDLNAKNHDRETPLEVAVRARHKEAVEKLLAHPKVVVDESVVRWAIYNGSDEIVECLLSTPKYTGPWNLCLTAAIEMCNIKRVEAILKKYSDPNHQDLQDAFVLAADRHRGFRRKNDIIEILWAFLGKGVSVNAKSSQFWGRTALHQAANYNNIDLVGQLLKVKSIDVNVVDDSGKSPLQLALEWPWLTVAVQIIDSKKVSKENLEIAKGQADKGRGWTDYGSVIQAINECKTA